MVKVARIDLERFVACAQLCPYNSTFEGQGLVPGSNLPISVTFLRPDGTTYTDTSTLRDPAFFDYLVGPRGTILLTTSDACTSNDSFRVQSYRVSGTSALDGSTVVSRDLYCP